MSWFKDIKDFSRDKTGTVLEITLHKKPNDDDGCNEWMLAQESVGFGWAYGYHTLVPYWMYGAFYNMSMDDSELSNIVKEAMTGFYVASQQDFLLCLMKESIDKKHLQLIGDDCNAVRIRIPLIQFNYRVENSTVNKVERRFAFTYPTGTTLKGVTPNNSGKGYNVEYISDCFGGFYLPYTPIIGIRTDGVAGFTTMEETLLHEYLHASYNVSGVKDIMYGEDSEIVTEESIVHFVTDHLDKLVDIRENALSPIKQFINARKKFSITIDSNGEELVDIILSTSWGNVTVEPVQVDNTDVCFTLRPADGRDMIWSYNSRANEWVYSENGKPVAVTDTMLSKFHIASDKHKGWSNVFSMNDIAKAADMGSKKLSGPKYKVNKRDFYKLKNDVMAQSKEHAKVTKALFSKGASNEWKAYVRRANGRGKAIMSKYAKLFSDIEQETVTLYNDLRNINKFTK